MTEYDYSPAAQEQWRRTQNRISNWVDDSDRHASQFRSPFTPSDGVQDNEFYRSRSASSSRRHTPSPSHSSHSHSSGRSAPQRSKTLHPPPTQPHVRSPLRSATISIVTPNDSISQVGSAPRTHSSHHRRAHSSSPTRHSRSKSSSHRSGRTAYVVNPGGAPQYPGVPYVQAPQPMPYMPYAQAQQPAAYIVHGRKVEVVVRSLSLSHPSKKSTDLTTASHGNL